MSERGYMATLVAGHPSTLVELVDQCIISVDMIPSREVSLGRRCSQAVWNASDLHGEGLP